MTEKEQQYYDEVVSILEKKGGIDFFDRQKLAKLGASLGLAAGKILELDQKAKVSRKHTSVTSPAEEQRPREKREDVSVEQQRKAEEEAIRLEQQRKAEEEAIRLRQQLKAEEEEKKKEEKERRIKEEEERIKKEVEKAIHSYETAPSQSGFYSVKVNNWGEGQAEPCSDLYSQLRKLLEKLGLGEYQWRKLLDSPLPFILVKKTSLEMVKLFVYALTKYKSGFAVIALSRSEVEQMEQKQKEIEEKQREIEKKKKEEEDKNTAAGCIVGLVVAICAVVAFWTGHWFIGIVLAIVAPVVMFAMIGFSQSK